MKRKKLLCKHCRIRPAEIPDRESSSSRKEVCRDCHYRLLKLDIAIINAVHGRPR